MGVKHRVFKCSINHRSRSDDVTLAVGFNPRTDWKFFPSRSDG